MKAENFGQKITRIQKFINKIKNPIKRFFSFYLIIELYL